MQRLNPHAFQSCIMSLSVKLKLTPTTAARFAAFVAKRNTSMSEVGDVAINSHIDRIEALDRRIAEQPPARFTPGVDGE